MAQPVDNQKWLNNVVLIGRISATAEDIELPSGDVLTRMRMVVPRERPVTRTTVDAIDLVCLRAVLRKRAHLLAVGDVVQVEGVLRRRFWRAGAAVASRIDVEVTSLRRR